MVLSTRSNYFECLHFNGLSYVIQGDSIEWTDANTTIICSLFAKQVKKGNRPNTHLNSVGYDEVSNEFFNLTAIRLTKRQMKNKWDKLKIDLTTWKKLMKKQTGAGWDRARGVIDMDDEWWKKAKAVSSETILFLLSNRFMSFLFVNNDDVLAGYSRLRQVSKKTVAK